MARQRSYKPKRTPTAKTVEVRIDAIGARGDGLAEVNGARVFIPYTAAGDRVRATLRGDHGDVENILEASAHRADPPCPHFGICGGCALQHLEEHYYRDWKRGLVIDALAREGFEENLVAPLIACPPSSRRRATFAVEKTPKVRLGFNRRRSKVIEPIDECFVLAPGLSQRLEFFRTLSSLLPFKAFDLSVTLCENGYDIDVQRKDANYFDATVIEKLASVMRGNKCVRLTLNGEPVLEFEKPLVTFGGVAVSPPSGGFLQASREGEAALTERVVTYAAGAKRIADLFSGCGTFSFPLSAYGAVDAFDANQAAIEVLDQASRMAATKHSVSAQLRNLFDRPLMAADLKNYDAVLFDPPRAGARAQAEEIAKTAVPAVIGVSCNPSTFARDAALLRGGGYVLKEVTPVDQFVYSSHVELVGLFTKG